MGSVVGVGFGVSLWVGAVICVGGDRRDFTLGLGPVAVFRVWIGFGLYSGVPVGIQVGICFSRMLTCNAMGFWQCADVEDEMRAYEGLCYGMDSTSRAIFGWMDGLAAGLLFFFFFFFGVRV